MTRSRYATITLVEGGKLRQARIIGAGSGPSELDLFIVHQDGRNWIGQDEIASIVYDACGKCGRSVVEDGYPVRGEIWHLDCATSLDPNA